MQLLSPEETKAKKARSEGEAEERIRRLRDEEAAANRALSQARQRLADETETLGRGFSAFKEGIEREKRELELEVASLEERKREAKRPLDDLREATERRIREAEQFEDELEEQLIKSKEKETEISVRLIELKAMEEEMRIMEEEAAVRMHMVEAEEARIKESEATLTGKWAEYHAAVHEFNKDVSQRGSVINAQMAVIEKRTKSLNELAFEIEKRRIAVQDGYESLARARREILGRDE